MLYGTLIYLVLLLQGVAGYGNFTLESETLFSFEGEFSNGEPMGLPKNVAVYSDGSFALTEYYTPEIKRFDSDGSYLETITRKGRGPGEFLDVEFIFVNDKDQLLAVDHVEMKLVAFNPDGTFEDHYIFGNRPSIRSFHQTKEGSYIVGMKAFLGIGEYKNDYLFQEINEDFEFKKKGFVILDDIHRAIKEEIGKQVTIGMPGSTASSVLTENDDLVLAPKLYSGTMLIFRGKTENGFSRKEYLEVDDYGRAVEEYTSSKKLDYDIVMNEGVSAYSSYKYFRYNRSLGLFRLNTAQIIHFIQVQEKGKPVLKAEVLNENAESIIGVQNVDRLGDLIIEDNRMNFETYSQINLELLYLDHQNRLFIAKHELSSHPELHVVQLKFE